MIFKPMLAPGEDPMSFPDYFKKLRYPLLCSPKYDGIRCIVRNGVCISRSGKILPSKQVQREFSKLEFFDGELIEGNPTDFDVYNRTQSHVMSEDKPGDLKFIVFDYTKDDILHLPYYIREEQIEIPSNYDNVFKIQQTLVENITELLDYERAILELGFEGIMMRDPVGKYKLGRGTFREGLIYKLKRFVDDEGLIIGFKEQMANKNVLEKDELGYAKRSTSKEHMLPADTLGNFIVEWRGIELDIAPGNFDHVDRKYIWDNKEHYIDKFLKFRYFSHGIKDKPRFPRAIGFRDEMDII